MKINLNNEYKLLTSSWEEKTIKLKDILEDKNIIYFYPKDNTPWCTKENKDFTNFKSEFENLWYKIIWVSKDSIDSHKKFIEKQWLNIDLISDENLILHKELWVYWEKKNYWKTFMWVIRSTFIVDKNWAILKEFRNVKATWHVERLLKELA